MSKPSAESCSCRCPIGRFGRLAVLSLLLIGLFAGVVYLTPLFVKPAEPLSKMGVQERKERLQELKANEAELATHYSWANKEAGTVRMPILHAMSLTLKAQQSKQQK